MNKKQSKKKLPYDPVRPVFVEWVDSMSSRGWEYPYKLADMRLAAVGHVVEKTKDHLVLSIGVGDNLATLSHLQIPMVAVKKIRKLKI